MSVCLISLLLLVSCHSDEPRWFEENPVHLSDWALMHVEADALELSDNVHPYFLNSALFTDYAHKLRTITVPGELHAHADDAGVIQFPIGTIISKTFFYPRKGSQLQKLKDEGQFVSENGALDLSEVQLVETRLLVHRSSGWVALPYVWNAAQTEATLSITGELKELSLVSEETVEHFNYLVPDQNQCAGCHETDTANGGIRPIGPKLANLSLGRGEREAGQIERFVDDGWLAATSLKYEGAPLENWHDTNADLSARARAYLDINCGHCHNAVGPADTSGLFLDHAVTQASRLGVCKLPIAAGQGTGGRHHSVVPGDADGSIMVYRMASIDPGAMMPELGRSLVHTEGVALISQWIDSLPGDCKSS